MRKVISVLFPFVAPAPGWGRRSLRVALGAALVAMIVSAAGPVEAQIYKYRKKDGTVVYTDQMSDLPPNIRRKYAEREANKARKRAQLEATLGAREVARREAEAKRRAELERQIQAADQQRRRQELQALLQRLNERDQKVAARKAEWQKRVADARARVATLYKKFQETQKAYSNIAVRADFALFPGQAKKKEELRKELAVLEKQLDEAIEELEVRIPEEARKAGVPPGWLR